MDEQLLIGIMMLVLAVSLPVEWGIEKWKKRARRKHILSAAQGVSCTQEKAFFFTKKAYCGNQTACVAESRKSVQTWDASPWQEARRVKACGLDPWAEPSRSSGRDSRRGLTGGVLGRIIKIS